MKKRSVLPVVAILVAIAYHAPAVPPALHRSSVPAVSSAGPGPATKSRDGIHKMAATESLIALTPVLLPVETSPSWKTAAEAVVNDARLDRLAERKVTDDPTVYARSYGLASWFNFVESPGTPLWRDVLDPAAPFEKERGQAVWVLVDARARSGRDDISLDAIHISIVSNDGNTLGDEIVFDDMSYTARAIAVRHDGSLITGGPTSQPAERVIVLVRSRLYNGAGTQNGLNVIRDWVVSNDPFKVTYTAFVKGFESVKSSTTVTVAKQFANPSPTLKVILVPDRVLEIWIADAEPTRSYRLYGRPDLATGSWQLMSVIYGSGIFHYPVSGPMMFFRAALQ